MIRKLTALLEYLNLDQNLNKEIFTSLCHFTAKIKQVTEPLFSIHSKILIVGFDFVMVCNHTMMLRNTMYAYNFITASDLKNIRTLSW